MVEVFKTNIHRQKAAKKILAVLSRHYPLCKINIDLKDCDRVLRIEGNNVSFEEIFELLHSSGYECHVLE